MSQVRTAVRGQVRAAIRGNVGNPVGFSAPYYDGIHLDFRTGRHYVKAPVASPTVAPFTSLFTFTGDNLSYYRAASGLYVASVTNTPRIEYDANGGLLGPLLEGSRQNQLLQARDQTAAAWVKTTMTAAKDQIGEDGVTNSASSLLATGASATSLQTIVQAAVNSTLSFSIKRLIGAGTVGICQDGATFTDVTAQINASTYTRVSLTASQLNPVLGIRLGTSGDKIAVDFGGFEAGAFASSRVPTTTVAVTRAADRPVRTLGSEFNATAGTIILELDYASQSAANFYAAYFHNGTANEAYILYQNVTDPIFLASAGGVNQAVIAGSPVNTPNTMLKWAGAYAVNDFAAVKNGGAVGTDVSGALATITTLTLGSDIGGATNQFGHIRRLDYYPSRLANNVLQQMTA